MGLETATYISDLVSTNPAANDAKSVGDDHIRLLKSTVKATFPNVTGAVTATHTELNIMDGVTASTAELNIMDGVTASTAEINILDGVTATTAELNCTDGVTSNIQTQLDAKADTNGETYTGAHNFTGGTVTVAAPTTGSNPVTKEYADALSMNAALPNQAGNSGKWVTTNGTSASWSALPTTGKHIVELNAGNGYGSTNNKIRRYTTTKTSVGTAITYADSATDGMTFTINETGLYELYVMDQRSSGGAEIVGFSVNSSELTTSVVSITAADIVGVGRMTADATNGNYCQLTISAYFTAGDVVRMHDAGTNDATGADYSKCRILKIGA